MSLIVQINSPGKLYRDYPLVPLSKTHNGDVSMDWSDRSLGSKEEKRGPPEDTVVKSRANKTYSSDRMQEFIIKAIHLDHNYVAPPPFISTDKNSSGILGHSTNIGGNLLPNSSTPGADQDEDANSVISSNPGREVEPEGEETETANEGEGDEDSITRCICEYEHDDGYMICCDKCFVWQHVDCMGIDRNNIPEEYRCERCEPRRIDRQRARTIQLRKREELRHTDTSSDASSSSSTDNEPVFRANNHLTNVAKKRNYQTNHVARRKQDSTPVKKVATPNVGAKRQRRESSARENSSSLYSHNQSSVVPRRGNQSAPSRRSRTVSEPKRTTSRRKNKHQTEESWLQTGHFTNPSNDRERIHQLRQWIDRYEEAVTNHYSPELRARLASIRPGNGLFNNSSGATVSAPSSPKCRISQLANNLRILVAAGSLPAQTSIIELRGKYMLWNQHPSYGWPSHHQPGGKRSRAQPGPFLFLYRLQRENTSICVDATTYGNDARFVRRSCKPNAELRHSIEKGAVHLYIVTLVPIEKNSEITIIHDKWYGNQETGPPPLTCACGNPSECSAISIPTPIQHPSKMHLTNERERRRRGGRTVSVEETPSTPAIIPAAVSSSEKVSPGPQTPQTPTVPPPQCTTNNTSSTIISNTNSSGPNTRRNSAKAAAAAAAAAQTINHEETCNPNSNSPTNVIVENHEHTCTDTQDKKKKLTREERKMEAIMKAFERMEKAEQRKQENQAKQAQRRDTGESITPVTPTPITLPKKEQDKDDINRHINNERPKRRRSNVFTRKSRGRSNSSCVPSGTSLRSRRSRLNSCDSDVTSADESITRAIKEHQETSPQSSPLSEQAAGILLAFSSGTSSTPLASTPINTTHLTTNMNSPPSYSMANNNNNNNNNINNNNNNNGDSAGSNSSLCSYSSSNPSTPLSSACLLVAAAVGPLAPGFKFPKTKKVIMNEWLNKSPEHSQELTSPDPNYDSLHTLANTVVGLESPVGRTGNSQGSAKKRWLRQAISEECDSPSPNSRTGSPPCSDHVTPLKKRRLARESMSSEQSFTPPTTPTLQTCGVVKEEPDSFRVGEDEDSVDSLSAKTFNSEVKPKLFGNIKGNLDLAMDIEEKLNQLSNKLNYSNEEKIFEEKSVPEEDSKNNLMYEIEKKFRPYDSPQKNESCDIKSISSQDYEENKTISFERNLNDTNSLALDVEAKLKLIMEGGEESNPIEPIPEIKEEIKQENTPNSIPIKRKLSISEYRQRKQINPTSSGTREEIPTLAKRRDRSDSSSSNSSNSSDDERNKSILDGPPPLTPLTLFLHPDPPEEKRGEVGWNSAPTLVERQRENLTERLRREFGLFLSDDEEQDRARKQALVASGEAFSAVNGIKKSDILLKSESIINSTNNLIDPITIPLGSKGFVETQLLHPPPPPPPPLPPPPPPPPVSSNLYPVTTTIKSTAYQPFANGSSTTNSTKPFHSAGAAKAYYQSTRP